MVTILDILKPLMDGVDDGQQMKLSGRMYRTMILLTESMRVWMLKNHPDKLFLLKFGHTEIFTEEMRKDYLEWCKTDEGRSYLKGGKNYKEPS